MPGHIFLPDYMDHPQVYYTSFGNPYINTIFAWMEQTMQQQEEGGGKEKG